MTSLSTQELAHHLVSHHMRKLRGYEKKDHLQMIFLKNKLDQAICQKLIFNLDREKAQCKFWYLTLCTDTCDFEESNICGYTQDKTDDFDWTRDNGGTTTRGTGPSADHTYGTKEGTFTLYL